MHTHEATIKEDVFNFEGNDHLFEGVLSSRTLAFVIDIIAISLMIGATTLFLIILGVATFGLLWFILPFVMPPIAFVIAVSYVAITAGGKHAATPGMRLLGLELRMIDGRKPYALIAVFHAISFYVLSTVLTPFIVLIGLITPRKRLLHDIISGMIITNKTDKDPALTP